MTAQIYLLNLIGPFGSEVISWRPGSVGIQNIFINLWWPGAGLRQAMATQFAPKLICTTWIFFEICCQYKGPGGAPGFKSWSVYGYRFDWSDFHAQTSKPNRPIRPASRLGDQAKDTMAIYVDYCTQMSFLGLLHESICPLFAPTKPQNLESQGHVWFQFAKAHA